MRIGIPDMISPSYFPVIAAAELGCFARRGIDAQVELVFPVTTTYERLRDGDLQLTAGAAHAALYAFDAWDGCRLLGAVSQHMYWFLVVRSDLDAARGDLGGLRGLRIGAAPGPVDGLRGMLRAVGIDPDVDLLLGPVPAAHDGNVSFGVTAAAALRRGDIDGFWANGMGAEVAVREGIGRVLVDVRRDAGFDAARATTFPVLATSQALLDREPEVVRAALAAVVEAQRLLAADPDLAATAARAVFPEHECRLIAELIERDAPYYDPTITPDTVRAVNAFARELGLLGPADVPYEQVVATELRSEWTA